MKTITKHQIRNHGLFVNKQGFRREGMTVIQASGLSPFEALQSCLVTLAGDGWDVSAIKNELSKKEKKEWRLENYSKDYQDNAVYWVSVAVTDALQPKFDIDAFKMELAALLEKHDVTLNVALEGDLHGVDENFEVYNNKNDEDRHILHSYNGYIDAGILRE